MEIVVRCPNCGKEQSEIGLVPVMENMGFMATMLEKAMGVKKVSHFAGIGKCECGELIKITFDVSSHVLPRH